MPFVKTTFTANTPITSTDLNTNNRDLRKYLNQEINPADLTDDSVDFPEIVRGEYFQVVPDHQFTSGDILSVKASAEIRDRSYMTGQTKCTVDFSGYTAYEPVAGSGKQFLCESDNQAMFYQVDICPHMPEDQLSSATYTTGEHVLLKVFVDGTALDYTFAYSFHEVSSAMTTPVSGTNKEKNQYRWYPMVIFASALSKGWHTVEIRMDVQSSHAIVKARNAYIELFNKIT
jgi:hypothetical protein